jgi:uncharacterized protein (TIGR00251 family)
VSTRLVIHVQPRARRTEVAGRHGDALKVRLAAPPVDGAANAELVRFLAEALGVPRRAVRVVAGQTARRKVVEVEGVAPGVLQAKLA